MTSLLKKKWKKNHMLRLHTLKKKIKSILNSHEINYKDVKENRRNAQTCTS